MIQDGFDIDIGTNSVDARQDDSTVKPGANRRDGIVLTCSAIVLFCAMMFATGQSHRSAWNNLKDTHWPSFMFVVSVVYAIFATGLSGSMFLNGLRRCFPSGAGFHCDRSTFTVSRIPWSNLNGKWTSQSFPIEDITEFKFGVTQQGGRSPSLYGFRFRAAGRRQKLFVGLEAPDAEDILKGLEHLGVNIVRDPDQQ